MPATTERQRAVHEVDLGAVTVGYEIDGDPNGVPVFLLHGFPDATATWDDVVELLDPAWLVVRPYIRGHGPTRVNPGHPVSAETAALATDVAQLADHLNIGRFHLVGSDWGCRAGYALAGLWPERVLSLTTMGTGYNEATPIAELSMRQVSSFWYQWLFNTPHGRALFAERTVELCRHLWRTWSPHWAFTEDEFAAAAPAFENAQFVNTVLHYYRYRWGADPLTPAYAQAQAEVEAMPAITGPTTHVQGLEDHCTRPETATRWEGRVTGPYRRIDLPGIGHFPQREVPDVVARIIADAIINASKEKA